MRSLQTFSTNRPYLRACKFVAYMEVHLTVLIYTFNDPNFWPNVQTERSFYRTTFWIPLVAQPASFAVTSGAPRITCHRPRTPLRSSPLGCHAPVACGTVHTSGGAAALVAAPAPRGVVCCSTPPDSGGVEPPRVNTDGWRSAESQQITAESVKSSGACSADWSKHWVFLLFFMLNIVLCCVAWRWKQCFDLFDVFWSIKVLPDFMDPGKKLWFNQFLALAKTHLVSYYLHHSAYLPPLVSLSCGPDGTLSALWATAIEAWLYCNVRGCSRHTGRQEALGEMNGWERLGGQIGLGDKGTMAARVPSRLIVEWPLQSLPGGRPSHTQLAAKAEAGGEEDRDGQMIQGDTAN